MDKMRELLIMNSKGQVEAKLVQIHGTNSCLPFDLNVLLKPLYSKHYTILNCLTEIS